MIVEDNEQMQLPQFQIPKQGSLLSLLHRLAALSARLRRLAGDVLSVAKNVAALQHDRLACVPEKKPLDALGGVQSKIRAVLRVEARMSTAVRQAPGRLRNPSSEEERNSRLKLPHKPSS
jgi:hypothetical protein